MRILFTSRGSAGHVGPLAPFAHAAVRAGHEVLVAAQPQNAAHVERLGLPFAPLADPPEHEWGPLMARLRELPFEDANVLMLGDFFAGIDTRASLPAMRELVERWRPDVIVRESWEYASALAGELHGVPVARVALGLVELEEETIRIAAPRLDALRETLGLTPGAAGDLLRASAFLTALPEGIEDPSAPAPARTHRFRHVAPADPAPLPDWWPGRGDDPLVYVTFGSVTAGDTMPYFPALYRGVIEALAPLPARVLVTVGVARDLSALGRLPANVHVEPWVPQDAVLPYASVVVGHGGHGTTIGALAHGLPLAVLPLFSVDQRVNGAAVARAGAGLVIGGTGPQPLCVPDAGDLAQVARAVDALLGDVPQRATARRIAADMAELPPVDAAVGVLESLAGERAAAASS